MSVLIPALSAAFSFTQTSLGTDLKVCEIEVPVVLDCSQSVGNINRIKSHGEGNGKSHEYHSKYVMEIHIKMKMRL